MKKRTFSINEFCISHSMSRTSLYELFKSGKGPATMLVGRRRMISIEAAKKWREKMECETQGGN